MPYRRICLCVLASLFLLVLAAWLWRYHLCSVAHRAVVYGDVEGISELVTRHEWLLTTRFRHRAGLIHLATFAGKRDVVTELLRAGGDLNLRDRSGFTPLYHAARSPDGQSADAARALVAWGADVNVVGLYDHTPLHHAASFGNVTLVRLLLELGADPHACSSSGATPLNMALAQGKGEAVTVLREAMSAIQGREQELRSPGSVDQW